MNINPRLGLLAAFVLSFSVYLIPIFNLHAGWQLLGRLLSGLDGLSALAAAWIGAVLLLQVLAFLLLFWVLTDVRWPKLLALVAAAPLFFLAANFGLLHAIPLLVLVERDGSPEIGELEPVCRIEDAAIAQVHSGSDLSLVRAGEVRLVETQQFNLAMLQMPGCEIISVGAPNYGSTIDPVAPGGHLLHRANDGGVHYVNLATGNSFRLVEPRDVPNWTPIISDDGMTLAWLERQRSDNAPGAHSLHTRNLVSGHEEEITLGFAARDQLQLIGARSQNGPFTIARHRNAVFSVDRDGVILHGPISPDQIYDARWGFRWLADGWVSWDGYRDEGQSHIVWNLPSGQGNLTIPRGRQIDSLGIAEDGSVIAVSFSSSVSIGNVGGSVVLYRTSDGTEIYRRHQSQFERANLAFIHSDHLAIDKSEDGRAVVEVYRIDP